LLTSHKKSQEKQAKEALSQAGISKIGVKIYFTA
jgi:hypothetical protein